MFGCCSRRSKQEPSPADRRLPSLYWNEKGDFPTKFPLSCHKFFETVQEYFLWGIYMYTGRRQWLVWSRTIWLTNDIGAQTNRSSPRTISKWDSWPWFYLWSQAKNQSGAFKRIRRDLLLRLCFYQILGKQRPIRWYRFRLGNSQSFFSPILPTGCSRWHSCASSADRRLPRIRWDWKWLHTDYSLPCHNFFNPIQEFLLWGI